MYSLRARVLESSRDELVQQVCELGESNEAARLVVERLREEEEHARRRCVCVASLRARAGAARSPAPQL
jgi:hypothetical protein